MLWEDSTLWKAHVAANVAKYSLRVRDLVRSGNVWKALRINQLVMDWDVAVAKYRIEQIISESHILAQQRQQQYQSSQKP
jgi:hypothetical protein